MGLLDYKISDGAISQYGVVAAPDRLIGDPQENKRVFDRLIRDVVKSMFNGLVDALLDTSAAGEIGAGVENVTGDNVQAILNSLKLMLDTKAPTAEVNAALAFKADSSVTDTHVKDVEFDADTGKFRFVKQSGAVVEFDTALEKVATNWVYDAATQSLVLTLADGTTQRVSLSDFVTLTEFVSSGSIEFSVSGNTVTAAIKPGSVTDAMLDSALKTMLQDYVSQASSSAGEAAASAAAAAESARQAASSKSASEQSAANAAESERQAALSEADAETYKQQAEASQRAAAQSEAEAKDAQAAAEKARDEAQGIVGGDFMDKEVYDPQGKARDVFKYVDDAIAEIPAPESEVFIVTFTSKTTDGTTTYSADKPHIDIFTAFREGKIVIAKYGSKVYSLISSSPSGTAFANVNDNLIEEISIASNGSTYLTKTQTLKTSGGTMTGNLTLAGEPTNALHAATKQYVDNEIGKIPAPDVSTQINSHNTNTSAHSDIRTAVSNAASAASTAQSAANTAQAAASAAQTAANARAQIAKGSYVGSQKYGQSDPNTLTFGFTPKIVFISTQDLPYSFYYLQGTEYARGFSNTSTDGGVKVTITGNTMSWYSTRDPYYQLNSSSHTYHYVAIG